MSNLSPVTPVEAANAITSMKSKTSPLDILSTDILKNCVDVFAVVISRLANLSFEQGIFPTAFKTAHMYVVVVAVVVVVVVVENIYKAPLVKKTSEVL